MRVLIVLTVALLTLVAAPVAHADPPQSDKVKDWQTWLQQSENDGGHTLACHVNVAPNGLIHRIESPGTVTPNCRQNAIASSFTNNATAAAAVKTMKRDIARACAGRAGRTIVGADAGSIIGQVVARFPGNNQSKNRFPCSTNKAYTCQKTRNFSAVIQKNEDNSCFLLTAYPNL